MPKQDETPRTEYRVADGVAVVAGRAVPADRKVTLTAREALYDLALGRIAVPAAERKAPKTVPPSSPVDVPKDETAGQGEATTGETDVGH